MNTKRCFVHTCHGFNVIIHLLSSIWEIYWQSFIFQSWVITATIECYSIYKNFDINFVAAAFTLRQNTY